MAKNSAGAARAQTKGNHADEITSGLTAEGVAEITAELRPLLADTFALYVKTKNFHWHMAGRHFRDYHLLLDEQGEQIFDMTDDIAERARKLGGTTLHSISDIAKHQRLKDNNEESVSAEDMLREVHSDNRDLTNFCGPRMKSVKNTMTWPQPA